MNPSKQIAELDKPEYNGIVDDLVAYTGLSKGRVLRYLSRVDGKNAQREFDWVAPQDHQELSWFYASTSSYLWDNALHPCDLRLGMIDGPCVLDYGAGVGCNAIELGRRGYSVEFVEISKLQSNFIQFRTIRHRLLCVYELMPYDSGVFDPVLCVRGFYNAILAVDVLEHIPKYHLALRHLITRLKPGGLLIENSPFDPQAADIALHLRASMPIEEAMVGMESLGNGVWRKI